MDCANHAGTPAFNNCGGCAEPFCESCLVTLKGVPYCGACKTMALPPGAVIKGFQACKEANEALKYALLGFVCFGIVLGPMAISTASEARKQMDQDPTLTGRGKANAATFLASLALILWVVGIINNFTRMAKHP